MQSIQDFPGFLYFIFLIEILPRDEVATLRCRESLATMLQGQWGINVSPGEEIWVAQPRKVISTQCPSLECAVVGRVFNLLPRNNL